MNDRDTSKRENQKRRTRKDLLRAAARLMQNGHMPTLEEVAEEALVSRATAYRYFPGVEPLLLEASLDIAIPEPEVLFADSADDDPVSRVDQVDAALHAMIEANEPALRLMLARSLDRSLKGEEAGDMPTRQNRRSPLIEAALAPAQAQFAPEALDRLSKALALIIGPEAMVVFKDVLQTEASEAREVKRWAIRALVEAARRPVSS